MSDNTVGNGSNLYFTANDSAGNEHEYGGLGAHIITNTNGAESGDLVFYTSDAGTIRSEKVRIKSNGCVGIGTSSPTQKLDIIGSYGTADDNSGILKIRGPGVGPTQLNFGVSADGGYGWIQATDIAVTNDKNIILNPLDGNVGIGTTSPSAKLHSWSS